MLNEAEELAPEDKTPIVPPEKFDIQGIPWMSYYIVADKELVALVFARDAHEALELVKSDTPPQVFSAMSTWQVSGMSVAEIDLMELIAPTEDSQVMIPLREWILQSILPENPSHPVFLVRGEPEWPHLRT